MDTNPSFTRSTAVMTIFSIVILYFARDLFIPLALAILISFLLAPVVQKLQHFHFHRVVAVFLVTLVSCFLIGFLTWAIAHEMLNLASDLPQYKENLVARIQSVQKGGVSLGKTSKTVKELNDEISKASPGSAPASGVAKVEIVEPPLSSMEILGKAIGPLVKPVGTAGIVIVFVIFMLLKREDLRDRLIRFVGRGRMVVTTQALDDAAGRVSRYLFLQLVINSAMGLCIGLGLHFIGIPNAVIWGCLAAVLRFIPYLGPWIAATFPTLLALAVFPTWGPVLLTLGLFLVFELVTGNIVEPWLYGAHTGVSSIALIVAAVFWTLLWGPLGLLLSTPLTVCLVVMGKYIPQLEFLDILLGDEPVLEPGERFYQRLVAGNAEEAEEILETELKAHSAIEVCDLVMLPALRRVQYDRHRGGLDQDRQGYVLENIREMAEQWSEVGEVSAKTGEKYVLCLPTHTEADEIAAGLFVNALNAGRVFARTRPKKRLIGETIEAIREQSPLMVCLSSLPPFSSSRTSFLCKSLRAYFPLMPILVCLWDATSEMDALKERLQAAGADRVVTKMVQGLAEVNRMIEPLRMKADVSAPEPLLSA